MIIDTDNNTISDDGLRWTTRDALIHVSKQLKYRFKTRIYCVQRTLLCPATMLAQSITLLKMQKNIKVP